MPQVYIRFPKTGLGNMLLVWARGVVFSGINQMEYKTSSWWGLRWGALLRRKQKKRLYWNYFKETPFLQQCILQLKYCFGKTIKEPQVAVIADNAKSDDLYVFNKVITDNDLFGQLRAHERLIAKELDNILSERIKKILASAKNPVIGIHVRRGDFKVGNPITTNEFFIKGINLILKVAGTNWPVTVFTDAEKFEIQDILSLPNVEIAAENPDIVDILLLSKSKIMLLSQCSTFSYWGAFLSQAVVIRPLSNWKKKKKNESPDSGYCEIKWDSTLDTSTNQLEEKLKQYFNNRLN